jgi:hypothetical protein
MSCIKAMDEEGGSKSLRQCMSNIPAKHVIKELQTQPYCAIHIYFGKY